MSYIKAGNDTSGNPVNIFYEDWGQGAPVVLIHGWPLDHTMWEHQAIGLAKGGLRVIAYDRRGFGRSSQPWSGYDYDTLADDLAAVIEQTDAQDAVLAGFSMGGGEVARYMSRHGGKSVSKAILVGSVVPYMLKTADNPLGTDKSVFDEMTKGMKKDRAEFFGTFFKAFYGVGVISHLVSEELLLASRNVAMQASLRATLACAGAFATTDFRGDLSAFKAPTLIIHGTADKIVPIDASSRSAAKAIANATLIEYDGAPHGLFATHKDRLTKDMLDFIGR